MKSKFGIVSSFDVLCGNATYSEAIAKGLESDFDVVKIDVPLDLQKNYDADLVEKLIDQIRACDHINIQMELGLYGPTPADAYKVLSKVMKACKHFSITMHRVELPPSNFVRQAYNHLKKGSLSALVNLIANQSVLKIIANYYKKVIDSAVKLDGSLIVHTEREKRRVLKINSVAKTFVYPIIWPQQICEGLNLQAKFKNDYPIVGLFGFISEYKNYEVVADGLLDRKFNIFIAGGSHPQAPFYGKKSVNKNPSYIRMISDRFSNRGYEGRVVIQTAPTDKELIQLMTSVDIVCVPYAETGQSGSGIASLAVQYGKRVIFSDTHCTSELVRFLNARPIVFDVDSPLGLFCAVEQVLDSSQPIQFSGYDFEGLLSLYKKSS